MSETRHVDTFGQNRVMEEHKLASFFLAPLCQRVEEYFTGDFSLVDICTEFRCNVQHIISTLRELMEQICVTEDVTKHTRRRHSNQHFSSGSLIEIVNNVLYSVTMHEVRILLINRVICLERDNRRRKNVTALNQLRCRDILNNRTKDLTVIHATIVTIRGARCCSEKILLRSRERHSSNTYKEMFSASVVCFIKINGIYIDTTINNAAQRVVSCEDNAGLICCPRSIIEKSKFVRFSGAEVVCLTTVAVRYMCVSCRNKLQEFFAQLISKKNARSNNNNGARGSVKQAANMLNHDDSLAATSRHNDLTVISGAHSIESAGLMRAESNGQSVFRVDASIIHTKKHP